MNSYEVRFWDLKKVGDTASGRWRVRWAVAGRAHCKSFPAKPLADGFLIGLKNAVRRPAAVRPGHRAARHPAAAGCRRRHHQLV